MVHEQQQTRSEKDLLQYELRDLVFHDPPFHIPVDAMSTERYALAYIKEPFVPDSQYILVNAQNGRRLLPFSWNVRTEKQVQAWVQRLIELLSDRLSPLGSLIKVLSEDELQQLAILAYLDARAEDKSEMSPIESVDEGILLKPGDQEEQNGEKKKEALGFPRSDMEVVQHLTELLIFHTGGIWNILSLTRFEQHWVVIGSQGDLTRAFLFEQAGEQVVYCVPEKILYPSAKRVVRLSTGTVEPLELTNYVIQYGEESGNAYTISSSFTQDALHDYLLNEHEPETDVLITRYYGEREEGEGHYRKHADETFTIISEEDGIVGLLHDLSLPVRPAVS